MKSSNLSYNRTDSKVGKNVGPTIDLLVGALTLLLDPGHSPLDTLQLTVSLVL